MVLCHDLVDTDSWNRAMFWLKEFLAENTTDDVVLAIVGTKLDLLDAGLQRAQKTKNILDYANTINAITIETSARTGENVKKVFDEIARTWHERYGNKKPQLSTPKINRTEIDLRRKRHEQSSSCC